MLCLFLLQASTSWWKQWFCSEECLPNFVRLCERCYITLSLLTKETACSVSLCSNDPVRNFIEVLMFRHVSQHGGLAAVLTDAASANRCSTKMISEINHRYKSDCIVVCWAETHRLSSRSAPPLTVAVIMDKSSKPHTQRLHLWKKLFLPQFNVVNVVNYMYSIFMCCELHHWARACCCTNSFTFKWLHSNVLLI